MYIGQLHLMWVNDISLMHVYGSMTSHYACILIRMSISVNFIIAIRIGTFKRSSQSNHKIPNPK